MARKQLKKGDKVKFVSGNYYNLTGGESMFDGKRLIILSKNINFDDINFDDLTGGESMFKNNSLTSLPKNINFDGITKMPMFKSFD